jgi:hypothetical protein
MKLIHQTIHSQILSSYKHLVCLCFHFATSYPYYKKPGVIPKNALQLMGMTQETAIVVQTLT